MTTDDRRRIHSILISAGILVVLVLVPFSSIELIQRHRFGMRKAALQATIDEIKSGVRFDINDKGGLITRDATDPRGVAPQVYRNNHSNESHEHAITWMVTGRFRDAAGKPFERIVYVSLFQERTGILGSPSILISLLGSSLTTLPEPLEARFKSRGLSYTLYP